jgi:predicted DCC family thiol-disulfide oxidoreductase YuxK
MKQNIPKGKILVEFDGMCILCSKTVQFILKADSKKKFVFKPLQQTSDKKEFETIVVTDEIRSYQYFDGILKIGYELGGIYRIVSIFKTFPEKWRLQIYLWVSRNRFKWVGKREECYLPTPDERDRFI